MLRGLAGEPWSRLRAQFEAHVDSIDPLRDLFDEVRRAGFDGDGLAVVMTAYHQLLRNEWSTMAEPKADFAAIGPRLARLDAKRLAPALIAWTRAYQRVPAPEFGLRRRLLAKWLWPFKWLKSAENRDFVEAVGRGELDTKQTRPTAQQLKARKGCLAWLGQYRCRSGIGLDLGQHQHAIGARTPRSSAAASDADAIAGAAAHERSERGALQSVAVVLYQVPPRTRQLSATGGLSKSVHASSHSPTLPLMSWMPGNPPTH